MRRFLQDDGVQGFILAAIMVGALFYEPLFWIGGCTVLSMILQPYDG